MGGLELVGNSGLREIELDTSGGKEAGRTPTVFNAAGLLCCAARISDACEIRAAQILLSHSAPLSPTLLYLYHFLSDGINCPLYSVPKITVVALTIASLLVKTLASD